MEGDRWDSGIATRSAERVIAWIRHVATAGPSIRRVTIRSLPTPLRTNVPSRPVVTGGRRWPNVPG